MPIFNFRGEERDLLLQNQLQNVNASEISAYFTNRWRKPVPESTVSEIIGTWLHEQEGAGDNVTVAVCDVTIDEAMSGLVGVITYIEAHPSMVCYHLHTLRLVLQQLGDYSKMLQMDDDSIVSMDTMGQYDFQDDPYVGDGSKVDTGSCNSSATTSGEITENFTSAVGDREYDYGDNEDEGDGDDDDGEDDEDDDSDDTLNYNTSLDNGTHDHKADLLFATLPQNLTVGKSSIDHGASLGIFATTDLSAGIRWGPYDSGHSKQDTMLRYNM